MLAGAPGEAQVAQLFLRRLSLAHHFHFERCVVRAQVGLLDEKTAGKAPHVVRQGIARRHLEDAQVAPAGQGFKGAFAIAGRDDDVVAHALAAARAEARPHRPAKVAVDGPIAGDDAAEG